MRCLFVFFLLTACKSESLPIEEECMPITTSDGLPVINDKGNTGKSVVITPDPLSNVTPVSLALVPAPPGSPVQSATLLNVSGDDVKSEVVSITLDNPNPFETTTNLIVGGAARILARPFARIEWGVGGVQSVAEVDFDHGLSLSIPCSYLRVTGVNDALPALISNLAGAGLPAFGRNVKLGAFCGYGAVSGTKNLSAKRTVYLDNVPAGAPPTLVKIPPFATNFTLVRIANTAPQFLFIADESGNTIAQMTYPIGSGFENPVELSGDASWIEIDNYAAGTDAIRIVFGLSF